MCHEELFALEKSTYTDELARELSPCHKGYRPLHHLLREDTQFCVYSTGGKGLPLTQFWGRR